MGASSAIDGSRLSLERRTCIVAIICSRPFPFLHLEWPRGRKGDRVVSVYEGHQCRSPPNRATIERDIGYDTVDLEGMDWRVEAESKRTERT